MVTYKNRKHIITDDKNGTICTACGEQFGNVKKLPVEYGGYLIECPTCGVWTKFDDAGIKEHILGMC